MFPLYIHIPFCKRKCDYCSFYSEKERRVPDWYIEALVGYIKHYRKKMGQPDTVYIGGGTPSLLLPGQIEKIMEAADPKPDAECTIEVNPDSANMRTLKIAKKLGINRVSVGIESFADEDLTVLGRRYTGYRCADVLTGLQKIGYENISMDIMFGVPYQDLDLLEFTIGGAVDLALPHVSVYNLTLEKGTKLADSGFEGNEDSELDMYLYLCKQLERYGYKQYELSNFCKPGYESKHNSVYWTDADYIGIGPSAHSRIKNRRYAYEPDIEQFVNKFKAQNFEFDYAYRLEEYDRVYEAVMLGLRTTKGMPLEVVEKVVGKSQVAKDICQRELGYIEDGRLKLKPRGMFVINFITNQFMLEYDLALKEQGKPGL